MSASKPEAARRERSRVSLATTMINDNDFKRRAPPRSARGAVVEPSCLLQAAPPTRICPSRAASVWPQALDEDITVGELKTLVYGASYSVQQTVVLGSWGRLSMVKAL